MELLKLDDLCLSKIFSYTSISTFQNLACTCQKLYSVSKQPSSVGAKHILKKTHYCFLHHIKSMVDRDDVYHSLEQLEGFKSSMMSILGSYLVLSFLSDSERYKQLFPKDIFEAIVKLSKFIPQNGFLPLEFTVRVKSGGKIYVKNSPSSPGFDFKEVPPQILVNQNK